MPIYEDYKKPGFDIEGLDVSISRPVNLCKLNLIGDREGKISVSNQLEILANLDEEGVTLFLGRNNMLLNSKKLNTGPLLPSFEHKIIFENILVQATAALEEDKYLAVASIESLKDYLPESINLDVNKDLMGVAFDAFVVNRGNKNGHIISTEVALSMVENFKNKPFNIEHNRKIVVGVCTGYGFSEFGSSKPLSYEDIKNTNQPFNVVLSGYVWKIVNPDFAQELLESSDPSSEKFLSVSASWELGFNEFNIAKGNKNLSEADIIDDEVLLNELKKSLRVFGGSGVDQDGSPLFLNLKGTVLPLGIGFTNTPAAEVQGVMTSTQLNNNLEDTKASENKEEKLDKAVLEEKIESSLIKDNKKSVQEENKNVKKIMKIENLEDINDDSLKTIEASAVRDFIKDRISELSKEWESKVSQKETEATEANNRISELEAELDKLKTHSVTVEAELSTLIEKAKQEEVERDFQKRMALVDAEFNLEDADREIIAEDLKSIASEEDFQKWYNKFSVLASGKKRQASSTIEEEKTSVNASSVEEGKTVEEIVSSAKQKEEVLPNAANSQEASLFDKINAAFNKNSIKIK